MAENGNWEFFVLIESIFRKDSRFLASRDNHFYAAFYKLWFKQAQKLSLFFDLKFSFKVIQWRIDLFLRSKIVQFSKTPENNFLVLD